VQYDPQVNVTLLVPQILAPSQSTKLSVNVSFLRTLRGHIKHGWELKYLDFYYTKVFANHSVFSETWSLRVPIEVEVQGCSNISSKSICSNSPGCLYCVTYADQRLLRADTDYNMPFDYIDTSSSSGSSGSARVRATGVSVEDTSSSVSDSIEEFNLQTNRQLYNNIVPSSIGDYESSVEGYCAAGKTTAASCAVTIVEYGTDRSLVWLVGVVIASSVSVILCLFSY